jgi:hypothetical protein
VDTLLGVFIGIPPSARRYISRYHLEENVNRENKGKKQENLKEKGRKVSDKGK